MTTGIFPSPHVKDQRPGLVPKAIFALSAICVGLIVCPAATSASTKLTKDQSAAFMSATCTSAADKILAVAPNPTSTNEQLVTYLIALDVNNADASKKFAGQGVVEALDARLFVDLSKLLKSQAGVAHKARSVVRSKGHKAAMSYLATNWSKLSPVQNALVTRLIKRTGLACDLLPGDRAYSGTSTTPRSKPTTLHTTTLVPQSNFGAPTTATVPAISLRSTKIRLMSL